MTPPTAPTGRIDVHQHLIPAPYRDALRAAGIAEAGGRALPDWSPDAALALMDDIGTAAAVLSVSTPGTAFLDDPADAAALARVVNTFGADLVADHPTRFGHFATLPLPDVAATAEAERALDDLHADGVVLLDTTRAAYLLVRNQVVRRYPNIRFVLSHAGGFVPYAAHRMALAIAGDTGASPRDALTDLRSFWFDTALSASSAALPSLLAFARPERVVFGSDWPFAPDPAVRYFAAGLDDHLDHTPFGSAVATAIDHDNAAALFPRLARRAPATPTAGRGAALRSALADRVVRAPVRLADPTRR